MTAKSPNKVTVSGPGGKGFNMSPGGTQFRPEHSPCRLRVPAVVTADQVRRSDERLATAGWGLVTALLRGPDGTPAGYTRVFVNSDRLHAQQDDTFVLRAHRGHRLGAALKSANLAQLTEQFPGVRHLHSWTAEGNDAMIATNRRFGFRPVETLHVMEGPVPQS